MSGQDTLFDVGTWWEKHWRGMPEFEQGELKPLWSMDVNLRSQEDFERFESLAGPASHDKWLWWPNKPYSRWRDLRYVNDVPVLPRYPIYIPSKGRWEYEVRTTSRTLDTLGVPYLMVVEPQERDNYLRAGIPEAQLLILPHSDRGLVATRNWIWDHAAASGTPRFWTIDDNIQGFYRLSKNMKIQGNSGAMLRAAEDFVDRYENVPIAGFQYEFFAMRRESYPPFVFNTRVYSNMLLQTDYREKDGSPFRNDPALRYNDDTDLNLRVLKSGDCTILFNAFLAKKKGTMMFKGGMGYKRSEIKEEDDRWKASNQLKEKHPDVAEVVWKWNRWHHEVDYSRFKDNLPRLRPGLEVPDGVNNYGMELKRVDGAAEEEPEVKPGTGPVGAVPTVQVSFLDSMPQPLPVIPDGWLPDALPDLSRVRGPIGFDFETDGLKWWRGKRPVGLAVAWQADGKVESRYLPFRHATGNLDEAVVRRWAQDTLRGRQLAGHNIKFDAHMAREWGLDLEALGCRLSCTMGRAALLDDHCQKFTLDAIARGALGEGKVTGLDAARMISYGAHQVTAYARKDAELTLRLLLYQEKEIQAQQLERVADLEDEVLWPTMEMERNAALLDVPKLKTWLHDSERDLFRLQLAVTKAAGRPINPDSPDDLARLFRERGLRSTVFTPGGKDSYAAAVLDALAEKDEVIGKIVQLRRLQGLRSKYLLPYSGLDGDGRPLPDTTVGVDGILRFSLHPLRSDEYGTVSGRFSMSKADRDGEGANLQQVFSVERQRELHGDAYPIRELIISPPGALFLAADAKQIEYRIFAHMSRSSRILAIYAENPEADYHELIGEMVLKYRPDFKRKRIKVANFAVLFGAGTNRVAEMFICSPSEAKEFLDAYDAAVPEARATLRLAMETARERGYVRTILGRRTRFPDRQRIHKALNGAVQGSAADLNKKKMVTLYRERKRIGLTMRITIHDEFVGDVPDQEAARLVAEVLSRQEIPLSVPILWSMKTGVNWKECK